MCQGVNAGSGTLEVSQRKSRQWGMQEEEFLTEQRKSHSTAQLAATN